MRKVFTSSHGERLDGGLEVSVAVVEERDGEVTVTSHERHPATRRVDRKHVSKLENYYTAAREVVGRQYVAAPFLSFHG